MSSTKETRTAILTILTNEADWMTLTGLRARFGQAIGREALDQALTDLHASREINLIPESNQKTLTDADRAAAIFLGGEYRHLASLPGR